MPRPATYDRDDLIERAHDQFWKHGWSGTSMKDLEICLNMRPGSFYAAFGSKDALYKLAMDRYADKGAETLGELVSAHGALGALQRYPFVLVAADRPIPNACMLARTLLELQAKAHPLADHARLHLDAAQKRFAIVFRAAMDEGDIGSGHDPNSLALNYQSDLMGLRVMAERPGVDTAAIAQHMSDQLDSL